MKEVQNHNARVVIGNKKGCHPLLKALKEEYFTLPFENVKKYKS